MLKTGLLASTACLIGLARVANAEPAPRTARLFYTGADLADCPDEGAIKNIVSARLGYDPFASDAEQIVTAVITREGKGLRGQVDLRDRAFAVRGSRVLTTDKIDCAELASSMALAISIAIDPLSLTRPAPVAQRALMPIEVAEPEPQAVAVPPPDVPVARARPERVVLRFGANASVAFGVTPGTSLAPGVFAGIGRGSVSLDLEGRAHLPSVVPATSASAPSGGSVSASLLIATLVPCFHVRIVMGCALAGIGSLSGTGRGVDVPSKDATLYANAGVRAGAEFPIFGPISARIYGDFLVPLIATNLALRGAEVWSTPSVTGALGAGLLGHLP